MDPLSIAASIIAVVQATNAILTTCYKIRAAFKDPPIVLSAVVAEVRDLRGVLEKLEGASDSLDPKGADAFSYLCDAEKGPLATCNAELVALEAKLGAVLESRRKAVMMALGLGINEQEIRASLQRIERCKSSLALALSADQSSMLRTVVQATESLQMDLNTSIDKIDGIASGISKDKADKQLQDILNWLSPLDPAESHEIASKARLPGTCRWLKDCWEYEAWVDSPGPAMLWLTASPGTGKTTIFASLVDMLQGEPLSPTIPIDEPPPLVAYFYCDFRQAEKQTLHHILGSLLAQILAELGECPSAVTEAYHKAARKTPKGSPTVDLIRESLLDLPAASRRVFLLVDALDENPAKVELAEFFASLLQDAGESHRLCIAATSRNEADIEDVLAAAGGVDDDEDGKFLDGKVARVRLEKHVVEVSRDITAYVAHRLDKDRKLKSLAKDVRDHVGSSLNTKANGMFRWVQCQLDSIAALRTARAVKGALGALPSGLNETYARILTGIAPGDRPMFRRILLWLSFAVLPLTLRQLGEVVAFEPGLDAVDDDARLGDAAEVLSIGGSLVSAVQSHHQYPYCDEVDSRVRLAHLSVRDFLVSPEIRSNSSSSAATAELSYFALERRAAHRELTRTCLAYLSLAELRAGPAKSYSDFYDRSQRLPLLTYAAIAFPYHFHEAKGGAGVDDPELDGLVGEFFTADDSSSSGRLFSWVQALLLSNHGAVRGTMRLEAISKGAPLYYAASFGLVDIVKVLLARPRKKAEVDSPGAAAEGGIDLDAPGGRYGGTALHAAVYRGQLAVVKMLVEAGANLDVVDLTGNTPLDLAITYQFAEAQDFLVDHGASVAQM